MIALVKRLVKHALARAGYAVMPRAEAEGIAALAASAQKLPIATGLLDAARHPALHALAEGRSQLGQDVFALEHCGWKRNGWFVEFGAADGVTLSNTWLLETRYGWSGIIAEPARHWHAALTASGRKAAIETDCVWSRSGEVLRFHEHPMAELSLLDVCAPEGTEARTDMRHYDVRTVSLNDLLVRHNAPAEIDYLSIDTEGAELEILQAFDFSRHRFRVITCEHNFGPDRQSLFNLLTAQGYRRVHEGVSQFDDWYVG